MADIAILRANEARAQIWKFSTDELRARLAQLLTITVDALGELAEVWIELERRGDDLSSLRSGLMTYVRMIARKEIMPEAVVRYAGHRHIIDKLGVMPLQAQAKLLRKPEVEVVTHKGTVTRQLHLLTPNEAEVALGPSGKRSLRAQRALIEQRAPTPAPDALGFRTIVVPMSGVEYARFKDIARRRKISLGHLVREAVLAAGLIG